MGIVDIALSQDGVSENGVNNVPYNKWYYGRTVSGSSYPWCAVFVCWCANQAGVGTNIVPKTASVSTLYDFYRKAGLFQPKGNGYKPKPGDILIQKSGGASHTGIVYSSDNSKFYTIEGNTSDKVAKRSYSYNDSKLTGFGTPNYDGSTMTGTPVQLPGDYMDNTGTGSTSGEGLGVGSYDYTRYTVKSGDTLQSIADKFNCTIGTIMFVNNLETSQIKEGQVLNVPSLVDNKVSTTGLNPLTKKATRKIELSHPVIEVEFYTEQGMLAAVSAGVNTDNGLNDLINVNTGRNMGQDCPTFSLSLIWRNDWFQLLSSNDLVIIKMQRPPETKKSVFFGLIDDIRKVLDFSSGQPQRAIQVTGRGFNKAFINFEVGKVENLSIDYGQGWMSNLLMLASCDSKTAIQLTLDSYIGKAIKYSFGNGTSFEDHFNYDGTPHSGELLVDETSYTSYMGSLWNFIKGLGNPPFNETYWEIQNEKPNMIHRPTPFNKEDWIKLERTTIKNHDIVSDNTGRSDLETYTLYSIENLLFNETASNFYFPLWYPPYYAKYGIKQLKVSTVYQLWKSTDGESTTDLNNIKQFYLDLFNFNIKNNVFSNGTITVKGKAKYRVGERVIIESENMEYYVEGVNHSFNCYGTWSTTLNLTRGINPENRFTAPWGNAEEFTPQIMNAILTQTSGEEIDWSNLPTMVGSSTSPGTTPGTYQNGQLMWPVPDSQNITSDYGWRTHPITGERNFHGGIDIGAGYGTPIIAVASGTVIASGPASGYGNWIKIDHGNGVVTLYGHMKTLLVKSGQSVTAGTTIALVGSEGNSTGPHLHFETIVNGEKVNPISYFNKRTTEVTSTGTPTDNEKACYNYFTGSMGLSKAGACALLANISAESGFKTGALGDSGTSYGICQWHNSRFDNLKTWCSNQGLSYTSINGQLQYLEHELKVSYKSTLNKLQSVPNTSQGAYDAAYYFCVHFEVPANIEQMGAQRGNIAKNTYWPRY